MVNSASDFSNQPGRAGIDRARSSQLVAHFGLLFFPDYGYYLQIVALAESYQDPRTRRGGEKQNKKRAPNKFEALR